MKILLKLVGFTVSLEMGGMKTPKPPWCSPWEAGGTRLKMSPSVPQKVHFAKPVCHTAEMSKYLVSFVPLSGFNEPILQQRVVLVWLRCQRPQKQLKPCFT